jgi:hypothetical protein
VTIEHDLIDDVARTRVVGDLLTPPDNDLLAAIVADHVRDARCSSIEIDLALVFKISQSATAAIGAMRDMARSHQKALRIAGPHGKVREELQREDVLSRGSECAAP